MVQSILFFRYKHIIEDKSTKSFCVDKKIKAWQRIASEYNASAESGDRTAKQIKMLYENMKRDLKKVSAEKNVRNTYFNTF